MTPRVVALAGARDRSDAMRRVIVLRLAEMLALAPALRRGEAHELHELRIACKRLRYALERFTAQAATVPAAAVRLAAIQDALGELHDRDVLLAAVPAAAEATRARLSRARARALVRARALWYEAFANGGPFAD